MSRKEAAFRRLALMVTLLLGAALACNAPLAEETVVPGTPQGSPDAVETVPPAASPSEATVSSPQTIPAAVETEEAGQEDVLPTFTPIQQPTLAATLTPSSTPRPRPTSTPRPGGTPSATPADTGGALSFTFNITWRLKDAAAKQAIATVTINARGGSGDYTYYRDDLVVDGPVFEYEWATCSGNPGSLRVDSSDGQTARQDYFQNPPCPTFTPTP